jgi:glutamyl-tRNA reductase
MQIFLLGVSHKTTDVATRELLAFSPDEATATMEELLRLPEVAEALLLSTCNRVELYVVTEENSADEAAVVRIVERAKSCDLRSAGFGVFRLKGWDAVRHLCRVAAGLDSMMLGEKQILGQVREAVALARRAGALGARLERVSSAALHAASRIHDETEIGSGAVSVASAAVALAHKVVGSLSAHRVLVVGVGNTGKLVARHFAKRSPAALTVASRNLARAEALASELECNAISLFDLDGALHAFDVIVSATAATDYVITIDMVRRAMAARSNRPLIMVDIAVPRDVDPEAGALENVFLHDIDALRRFIDRSLARRRREVPKAETIVEEETRRLISWIRSLSVAPVVRELRDHFERVRAREVAKNLKHCSAEERARVESLTRSLINKLLHLPTTRLKSIDARNANDLLRLQAVRELFALDDTETDSADDSEPEGSGPPRDHPP